VQWAIGSLAAAAIIGFFVVGRRDERPVTDARRTAVAGTLQPGGVIRTDVGVRDSVVLSDGTRVLLAPSSRLIVSQTYGRGAREVTLEGMARFSVQHDSAAPFVVHAGNAVIRDVGTEFVVRAPASAANEHVAVAVLEGEVTIAARSSSQTPTSLHAGDRGEMQTGGAVVVERGTANDADVAWTRGALAYRAAPLESVRDDLRRWYGVELQIADSALTSRRLTATFDANDTAEQVLNTIALALGADVERTGTVATLRRAARPK
jgi:transmembrane sensor